MVITDSVDNMARQLTIISSGFKSDFLDIGFASDDYEHIRFAKINKRIRQLADDNGIKIECPLLAIVDDGKQYRIRYNDCLEAGVLPKGITGIAEFINNFAEKYENPIIVEYSSNFMLDRAYRRLPSNRVDVEDLR